MTPTGRALPVAVVLTALLLPPVTAPVAAGQARPPRGRPLGAMSWVDAKAALGPDTVVVIPIGAQAKEHGPHLPLDTDYRQAEYFKGRVMAEADVIVAPTINYSFYPAFVEYPGSTSLDEAVARDLVVDVVRSIARFGPRRFYVINIGVSTNKPLSQAVALLALDGVALRYLDLTGAAVEAVAKPLQKQREGTHADEIETSVMLAIDARAVDMKKAPTDYEMGKGRGPFSLDPKSPRYNPSGIYGDATLATVEKGRQLTDGITRVILSEIEELRRSAPPPPATIYGGAAPRVPPPAAPSPSK